MYEHLKCHHSDTRLLVDTFLDSIPPKNPRHHDEEILEPITNVLLKNEKTN